MTTLQVLDAWYRRYGTLGDGCWAPAVLSTIAVVVRFDRSPLMELICEACRALLDAGDGIDSRPCWRCTVTVGCRHEMCKMKVCIVGGEWTEQIVCKDWAPCFMRSARKIIKEG